MFCLEAVPKGHPSALRHFRQECIVGTVLPPVVFMVTTQSFLSMYDCEKAHRGHFRPGNYQCSHRCNEIATAPEEEQSQFRLNYDKTFRSFGSHNKEISLQWKKLNIVTLVSLRCIECYPNSNYNSLQNVKCLFCRENTRITVILVPRRQYLFALIVLHKKNNETIINKINRNRSILDIIGCLCFKTMEVLISHSSFS
jgi:hypothetical protein